MVRSLDDKVTAVCECGLEKRTTTYRTLKNKWPVCSCKQSMKVKSLKTPKEEHDAVTNVSTSNGMGDA